MVTMGAYPAYQALSYCWGSSDLSVELRCDGCTVMISPNLAEGLGRLHLYARRRGRKSPPLYWIDQICINQQDDIERTQQVRMMRDIYQQSTDTIIWLPLENGE
jgi:hypothetical protein